MIMKMIKEVCEPCSKSINIGQPILECEVCHKAIHTKCYKSSGFSPVNNLWVCKVCSFKIIPRYNPFEILAKGDSDKFYDEAGGEEEAIGLISDILNNCLNYKTTEMNKATCNLQPSLSSFFLNIDGNASNFDSLLVELSRLTHKFSIIALAETNTDQPLKDHYQIPGYNSFYQSTTENKSKGTGVAIYAADHLNVENLGGCLPDIESLFVRVTLPNNECPMTYGVVYRPPNSNLDTFMNEFNLLNQLLPNSNTRILGDFNLDLLKINTMSGNNACTQFEDSFLKAGLTPVISIPTHRREGCKPSCIDNILTSNPENVFLSGTIDFLTNDHLAVFEITNVSTKFEPKQEKHIRFYEYSNKNLEQFVEKLENDLNNIDSINEFSEFTEIFHGALDSTCKLLRPKTTKRTFQNNPWITDSIKTAIDRKHEMKEEWVNSIDKKTRPLGDQCLKKSFTDYRRVLKAVINAAKNSYNCNRILDNKHDRKKTWQVINELRGKSKKIIKPSIVIDNQKITDRRIIANQFNKYFSSIASKLNETISDLSDSQFSSFEEFLMPSNKNSIFLNDCSPAELLEIVKELDNSKSSDIPIRVIKKSAHVICPYLSLYFNHYMTIGHFPDNLKVGKVTPIFKKGNTEDVGNFRPVSTLPIFGKIFEKVIYRRIYDFALSQKILDQNQFGFRKSHGTSYAVNYSMKIVQDALKDKQHVLGIFIDLSKAFDTIDHSTLLVKLDR